MPTDDIFDTAWDVAKQDSDDIEKGMLSNFARKVRAQQQQREAINAWIVENLLNDPQGWEKYENTLAELQTPPPMPPPEPESVGRDVTATPPPPPEEAPPIEEESRDDTLAGLPDEDEEGEPDWLDAPATRAEPTNVGDSFEAPEQELSGEEREHRGKTPEQQQRNIDAMITEQDEEPKPDPPTEEEEMPEEGIAQDWKMQLIEEQDPEEVIRTWIAFILAAEEGDPHAHNALNQLTRPAEVKHIAEKMGLEHHQLVTEQRAALETGSRRLEERGFDEQGRERLAESEEDVDVGLPTTEEGDESMRVPDTLAEDSEKIGEDETGNKVAPPFEFPETRKGGKLKGKSEAQTSLSDDAAMALEGAGGTPLPILDARGNPVKIDKRTGWYVKHGSWGETKGKGKKAETTQHEGPVAFHEDDPDTTMSLASLKLPKKALGKLYIADVKPNPQKYTTEEEAERNDKALKNKSIPIPLFYPMPGSHAINTKTKEKIKSQDTSFNDAWTVVKDPFANPFHNPNAFSLADEQPPEVTQDTTPTFSVDTSLIKGETPEDALRNAGFDARKGDDLSLLPSGALNADTPTDDTSLLPKGWDSE